MADCGETWEPLHYARSIDEVICNHDKDLVTCWVLWPALTPTLELEELLLDQRKIGSITGWLMVSTLFLMGN